MAKRRGRPPGTSGHAAVLSASHVRQVFRVARSRSRHSARAEATLAISLGLKLRAKELTSLKWDDVYDAKGHVRSVLHLRASYTKGGKTRDMFLSSPTLRRALAKYGEGRWPLSTKSNTRRAIGAAAPAPKPAFSITSASAICGVSSGANAV